MKKGLFLLFLSLPCFAEGPRYRHLDKTTNLEFQNVYQDLRDINAVSSSTLPSGSTQYIQNGNAPQTATFNVTSGTVNGVWSTLITGEITQPLQPSFLETAGTGTNVTGNGTVYTVTWTTEIFDQGGDFSSNTFTASVPGRYQLNVKVEVEGMSTAANTDMELNLVTSNRTYRNRISDIPTSVTTMSLELGVLADMDAADTATVTFTASGGAQVVDVTGGGDSTFSGSLIN